MDILPHFPFIEYEATNFTINEFLKFLMELKEAIENLDLSDYVKKEDFNKLKEEVDSIKDDLDLINSTLEKKIEDLENDLSDTKKELNELQDELEDYKLEVSAEIDEIRSLIDSLKDEIDTRISNIEKWINEPIGIVQVTFTNPAYFYASRETNEYYNYWSNMSCIGVSFTGDVKQDIQITDDVLEIVNVTLNRNVELDLRKTPNHFYVPMGVDIFDDEGNFIRCDVYMIDAELSIETNSYDISFYFHGEIEGVNEYTKFHLSANIPYFIERS